MIIKRDHHQRFARTPNPERAQMVEIAGAVKQERGESLTALAIKFLDQPRRRGETKMWTPAGNVEGLDGKRSSRPGSIQIQMKRRGHRLNAAYPLFLRRHRRFFS